MNTISIIRPDDWHCHLRDGAYLQRTVVDVAARFNRVVVMPNLNPPIINCEQAFSYRQRIMQNLPAGLDFDPLLALYLKVDMDPTTLKEAATLDWIIGAKLYPAGVTTNSAQGIEHISSIDPLLAVMEEQQLPLLIHGECNHASTDIFDREGVFLDRDLAKILQKFPKLRIVLEHISTKAAVDFVKSAPSNLAATITAHHLLYNRNQLLSGGIHPHYYCLPILKRREDQEALLAAALSGNPKFFLGTDSAPHARGNKESAHGCAGIYTAHAAIELYAEIFDQHQALDKLENFASVYGAQFYRRPINTTKIELLRSSWSVPNQLSFGDTELIPLLAGEKIHWRVAHLTYPDTLDN